MIKYIVTVIKAILYTTAYDTVKRSNRLWCFQRGWGMHIYVGKLTIIGSGNGSSPGQHQAIMWTNAGILLTGPPVTNFSAILIKIHTFSFKKIHLKMSSLKWRPFCLGLSVLKNVPSLSWLPAVFPWPHIAERLQLVCWGIPDLI